MNISFNTFVIPKNAYKTNSKAHLPNVSFKGSYDDFYESGGMSDAFFRKFVPETQKIELTNTDIINWQEGHTIPVKESKAIDLEKLGDIKSKIKVRRDNVISGPVLTSLKEGLDRVKDAGIRTIIALPGAHSEAYCNAVEQKGFKYINLFGTSGQIFDNPVFDKNIHRQAGVDKFVQEMKTLFSIINGKNADFPTPVYMGCERGVTRTGFISCLNYVFNMGEKNKEIPYTMFNSKAADLLDVLSDKLDEHNFKALGIDDLMVIKGRIADLVRKIR